MDQQQRLGRGGRAAVAAAVVAAAAAAAYALWPVPPVDRDRAEADAEARRTLARAEAARLSPGERWHSSRVLGGSYAFDLDLQMSSTLATGRSDRQTTLRATLELAAASSSEAEGTWIVGRMRDLKADGDPQLASQLGLTGKGEAELSAPFAVRVDASGAVVERRFDPRLAVGQRNLVATLAAGVQVVATPQAKGGAWRAAEPGASDTQHASYQQLADGGLRKTWSRQRSDTPGDPAAAAVQDVVADGEVKLTMRDGILAAAAYEHRLVADLTLHPSVPQRHEVRTAFNLVRRGDAPKELAQVRPPSLASEAQLATKPSRPSAKSDTRSVAQLLEASDQAQASGDWLGRSTAAQDLGAKLHSDAAALAQIKGELWQPGLDGDGLRTRLEALALAGTPESLGTLRMLISDLAAPYLARHGAASLATTLSQCDAALAAALMARADDEADAIRSPAALAVGAQARIQLERNPTLAGQLQQYVLQRAAAALARDNDPSKPGPNNPALWLEVLGNMGGAAAWPLVEPALAHQRDDMRLNAIEALRAIQLPAARVALAKALQLDPKGRNRRRAAEIALYHPQQAMEEPVVRALREDPDEIVLIGAAHTAAVWGVQSPGLYLEIAEAAKRARKPEVKQILAGLQPEEIKDPAAGGQP